jgi:hypothetical protein
VSTETPDCLLRGELFMDRIRSRSCFWLSEIGNDRNRLIEPTRPLGFSSRLVAPISCRHHERLFSDWRS